MNKSKTKRTVIISVIAAVVVIAAVIVILKLTVGKGKPVSVYPMTDVAMDSYWGDTSETEGTVRTDNMQSVFVSATQSVTEVFVKEGQSVKAGDKLVAFDTTLSDLELERQRLTVEKLQLSLQNAKKELNKINSYIPYVPPEPVPPEEPVVLDPVPLPYADGGEGTEELPYIYLWSDECWYTSEFFDKIIPLVPYDGEISEDETLPSPDYKEQHVFVVFEKREYNNPGGELIEYWGIEFIRLGNGGFKFAKYSPLPGYRGELEEPEPEPEEPIFDPDTPMFTASEIARMRSEKEHEISDLELNIKVETVKYKKLQLEVNTGIVTAELDGVVKTLTDPEEAQNNGTAFIVVSGGEGGYYVEGCLSELELETVHVGQTVTVTSWMNYQEIEAEIVSISTDPSDSGYNWTNGNQNVSYYPFTVYISDEYSLQDGEYVSIRYSAATSSNGIYLQTPFLVNESTGSFVYVLTGENRLEKREVSVGKMLWGSNVEIISGLTMEDYVAFPYGNDVKDGAEAVISSINELYSY